ADWCRLSEIFVSRNRVIQGADLWYLVWNIGCGFAQNTGELLAFGFFPGSVERLQYIFLAPLLDPVVGPLCGAFIAEKSTWRWVFWSTSIVDVGIQILGILYLRESYAPFVLEQKADQIRASLPTKVRVPLDTSGRNLPARIARTSCLATHPSVPLLNITHSWQRIMKIALTRPFVLFINEPIVQVLGLYMAFIYGLFYRTYGESVGVSGIDYLTFGVGVTGASQVNTQFMDWMFRRLKERNGGKGRPEYRIRACFLPHISRIALVGAGIILNFQSIQIYVVDAFALYAASALASVGCLRSLFGFAFPLFAEQMYRKLGYGKGHTILAVIAVIGCPSQWLLWTYGKQLRVRSKFAKRPTQHGWIRVGVG
ncbi:major facilitator superfamily domain-containing protein, partial [Mycena albidolilacea]